MASLGRSLGVLLAIAVLPSFSCAGEVVPDTITVTGTTISEVDGTYVRTEDYNGRPQWKKGDGSDAWFYFGSYKRWVMTDSAADRSANMGLVASTTAGAPTPLQVPSWNVSIHHVWTLQASISMSVPARYAGELLEEVHVQQNASRKAQEELNDTKKALQEAERDFNDTKRSLQEAQRQLESNATSLRKVQMHLNDTNQSLQEAQKELVDTKGSLQEAQTHLALLQKAIIGVALLMIVAGITAALLMRKDPFSYVIADHEDDGKLVRRVRIMCPGVDKVRDVTIKSIFSGAVVEIHRPASLGLPACRWIKRFEFKPSGGPFELKEDDSQLEQGVLDIVFWVQESQQRIFRFPAEGIASAWAAVGGRMPPGVLGDDESGTPWIPMTSHTAEGSHASAEGGAREFAQSWRARCASRFKDHACGRGEDMELGGSVARFAAAL